MMEGSDSMLDAARPRGPIWSAIVCACEERGITGQQADDVAFHMTDWMADFCWLQRFFADPGRFEAAEIEENLVNVLVHAPSHIAAAKKLFLGDPVTDVFEIGAVSEQSDGD
jgi:hypothetical protein